MSQNEKSCSHGLELRKANVGIKEENVAKSTKFFIHAAKVLPLTSLLQIIIKDIYISDSRQIRHLFQPLVEVSSFTPAIIFFKL